MALEKIGMAPAPAVDTEKRDCLWNANARTRTIGVVRYPQVAQVPRGLGGGFPGDPPSMRIAVRLPDRSLFNTAQAEKDLICPIDI